MAMKRYQQLSVWGSLGTLCLVLGPGCDDDSANDDGNGGDGGETTGSGGSTGGTDSGGSGGATGGTSSAGSAGLGAGPSVPDCEDDEWLEPESETCEPCVVHTHTCADFVDATPGSGGDTNPGTDWDRDTNTLTFELREGLPPIVEASVSFGYYYRDGTNTLTPAGTVSSEMSVADGILTATFSGQEPLSDAWGADLSVTDACGNETNLVAYDTSWPSWQYNDPGYGFYCEGE